MSFQPPPGNPPPAPSGGWQPPVPPPGVPPPSPPKRSRKGLVIGLGIGAAVVLLLIVIGLATIANRVGGGTSLGDLHRGECFNTSKALVAEQASRVSCAKPHTDEVAGILRLPGGDGTAYPGQQGILDFGKRDCLTQVQQFFGQKTPSATTQVFVFGPNKAAWGNGERTVVCSLREPSASKRRGSYLDG